MANETDEQQLQGDAELGSAPHELVRVPEEEGGPREEHLGVIRLAFGGFWTAADLATLMRSLEYAYASALEVELVDIESLRGGQTSPLQDEYDHQVSGVPDYRSESYHNWREKRLGTIPGRPRLGVLDLSFASPGFMHLVGSLNPLKAIGDMVNWFVFLRSNRAGRDLDNQKRALENEALSIKNDIDRAGRAVAWANAQAFNDRVAFQKLELVQKRSQMMREAGYERVKIEEYLEAELLAPVRLLEPFVQRNGLRAGMPSEFQFKLPELPSSPPFDAEFTEVERTESLPAAVPPSSPHETRGGTGS